MHRFLVPAGTLAGSTIRLEGEVAQQISRVLRMRPGEECCLLDGVGNEYCVRLAEIGAREVTAELLTSSPVATEPTHRLDLYLSLLNKPDKFEWALQKCTELGVSRLVPVIAGRSVPADLGRPRRERWERIIREAVEQSGRGIVPALDDPVPLVEALDREAGRVRAGEHVALMPVLGANATIRGTLAGQSQLKSVGLIVGPEGGFTETELRRAESMGIVPVAMGPRTLRSETAAVVAVALTMDALGEMG